jgi:ectoine hydroxylase-related dioxygenase (phytanoyl-CoA dioxygenase family)
MNAACGVRSAEAKNFAQIDRDGFQIIRSFVPPGECDKLSTELSQVFQKQAEAAKGRIGGVRNLLQINPFISQFSRSPAILALLQHAAGSPAFPVRSIFFDKNPGANWLVPWHQDLAIAVAAQIETPGFSGWSIKDGAMHVHPPNEILAGMLTLRVHLDDCEAGNGALKVIAGSHRDGKLSAEEIGQWIRTHRETVCEIPKGGALLMRPLLLHSSSPADAPSHRRVLHIEYATQKLPNGLRWLEN